MHSSLHEKAGNTFLKVVEQLSFMFGEPVPKDEIEAEDVTFVMASMAFGGDLTGTLIMAVPQEVTADIAANILGMDPAEVQAEELRRDALAEMLNVVCGHVIMAISGADANFKLRSPETKIADEDMLPRMMGDDDFMAFLLDDNPVFLGLVLEN